MSVDTRYGKGNLNTAIGEITTYKSDAGDLDTFVIKDYFKHLHSDQVINIYTVFDKVAKQCSSPILLENDDVAIRFFNLEVKAKVDPSCAEDYEIYQIGVFDSKQGHLVPLQFNKLIFPVSDSKVEEVKA